MKKFLGGVAIFAASFAIALGAVAGTLPGPVVSTQWLADNLDKVQVVEVRTNVKSFTAKPEVETDPKSGKKSIVEVGGHIPNSRLIDMKNVRMDRQIGNVTVKLMIPERAAFQKVIQDAGVDADKPIVLVPVGIDFADMDDVLRTYWQLKVYGEDSMAVLDGGMATWILEGRVTSSDAASQKTGTWVSKADRSDQYLATSDDVAKAMSAKSATLIDSRDERFFHGLAKRDIVGAYGHLEGAKLYSTDLLLTPAAGGSSKFMSVNTYKGLMAAQGIDSSTPAISYCNTGHLASGTWFVNSELLGNKSAKLYAGSLQEWTLEKRPVVGAVPMN